MIGSLHDLGCAGPSDCTCNPIAMGDALERLPLRKPTPKVKTPKLLKSRVHGIPERVRQDTFAREDWTCAWCGVPGGALDFHHRLLRSQGGRDVSHHGVAVHRLCHSEIHRNVSEAKRRRFIVSSEASLSEPWTA